MQPTKLFTDERAISPVVGVALLIAIAVILATVIGAVVLGLGPGGADAPQADAVADYNQTGAEITIEHRGGDPLDAEEVNVTAGGESVALSSLDDASLNDGELTAGESFVLNDSADFTAGSPLTNGETVTVIWQSPNGDKEVIVKTFDP